MAIAVSAAGTSLEADVDPRFGRCQYFILVDPETMEFEALENSSAMAAGGAGIATAQMVVEKGVEAVLTGNCGPNAYQVLSAAGVQVITGASGKIKDAVEAYRYGKLSAAGQANVADHFGMGSGGGRSGGGMGRGMGGGMGRGAGGGVGRGMGGGMMSPANQTGGLEQGLQDLKAQSQLLSQQMTDIQRRLEDLEKKNK